MMDWREAADEFPLLTQADLSRLRLPAEDQAYVLSQFNRAVVNAKADSADIATITLKKLLTKYSTWGEAALLFGICLAMEGKYKRAAASFQHAISAGLITESFAYSAQEYFRAASEQYAMEHKKNETDDDADAKRLVSSIFQQKKSSVPYRDSDSTERVHMQAPILMKVPRSPGKSMVASERERIDVMKSSSSNGEMPDDEINVSIPKTPAEKLRILIVTLSVILLTALLGMLVWYKIIPWVSSLEDERSANTKLTFLLAKLEEQKADPEVSQIIANYEAAFPSDTPAPTITPVPSLTSAVSPTATPFPTVSLAPVTQGPVTQVPVTQTPTLTP